MPLIHGPSGKERVSLPFGTRGLGGDSSARGGCRSPAHLRRPRLMCLWRRQVSHASPARAGATGCQLEQQRQAVKAAAVRIAGHHGSNRGVAAGGLIVVVMCDRLSVLQLLRGGAAA